MCYKRSQHKRLLLHLLIICLILNTFHFGIMSPFAFLFVIYIAPLGV